MEPSESAAPLVTLDGRVALVTGAGQGIGRAIATTLAHCGAACVVVNDFHAERATDVAREIESTGRRARSWAADVRDFQSVAGGLREIEAECGVIDVLVNNAGNAGPEQAIESPPPFWETGPEDWTNWLDTNLLGVMHVCRAVLPKMIEGRSGRIVTVISDAARVGHPRFPVYAAAKAGAAGFMRSLALAVGAHGITANCVSLGGIETPGLAGLRQDPARVEREIRRNPIPRLGQPDDAAAAVAFLASDAAGWITGQTLPVNGGFSAAL